MVLVELSITEEDGEPSLSKINSSLSIAWILLTAQVPTPINFLVST